VNRVVFLDRDGVINRAVTREGRPFPPASVEQIEILPDVSEALALLKRSGMRLAVVTNQPDVARGTQTRENVEAINAFLAARLPLDRFEVCFHDDTGNCDCRKPKPGLIRSAAQALGSDPTQGFVVGDRWRDIEAGRAAGCRTVWIDRGYDEKSPAQYDYRAESLLDAAQWIIGQVNISTTR
jgi:D-glycero-D-manno-heptose 1,7-bisphosphate phosphatase